MFASSIDRRTLIGGLGSALAFSGVAKAASPIRAIAFDAFPILDPRSLTALAIDLVGQRGDVLMSQSSAKLFGYTWLETAAHRYTGFRSLADVAIRQTATSLDIRLSDADRSRLVDHYDQLDVWPDVKPALERLSKAKIRMAFLSNLSASTLQANMDRNGLGAFFGQPLSTDRVRQFKPAPAAYAMAVKAFNLPMRDIGFAAFGGWDAMGASWFGYRTAWVNRPGTAEETLNAPIAVAGRGMDAVLRLAGLA